MVLNNLQLFLDTKHTNQIRWKTNYAKPDNLHTFVSLFMFVSKQKVVMDNGKKSAQSAHVVFQFNSCFCVDRYYRRNKIER